MKIFHVLMGGAEHRALRLFDDNSLNLLVAASMLTFEGRWKKHLDLIHRKKKLLFTDSGLLGWIKKLGREALEYAAQPDKVLEIQLQIDPDIVAALDHPCEPSILARSGMGLPEALSLTINNALWLVEKKEVGDERLKNRIVAVVVQGYDRRDYEYCLREFQRLGFFDLNPEEYWFAIGSVCMRKPPELYEIVKFVRERIPERFHVHCFGIANPKWVLEMKKYGINSVDSATGGFAAAMGELIGWGGKRIRLKFPKKNKHIFNALVAFNWASLELQVESDAEPDLSLFEEELPCPT